MEEQQETETKTEAVEQEQVSLMSTYLARRLYALQTDLNILQFMKYTLVEYSFNFCISETKMFCIHL